MKPIAHSPQKTTTIIWCNGFCSNVLGLIKFTKWVESALFSLYQTPAGFWTIFWMVETPVPNNSSHPISGSGFVVPVPLKGTFFEKKMLAPSLLRKFTKLWIQMTSLQYNSTRQCAVHTVADALMPWSPFVSYCSLQHCTTLFSVHCARSCQDGKPHFWRLLFELYLRWDNFRACWIVQDYRLQRSRQKSNGETVLGTSIERGRNWLEVERRLGAVQGTWR